jgi:hypothetical protein
MERRVFLGGLSTAYLDPAGAQPATASLSDSGGDEGRSAPGVSEKRGAGAGCIVPATVV